MAFSGLVDDALRQVTGIKIESKYTPSIFLEKPFEQSDEPGIVSKLKPRVTIYTKNYKPFVSQIYGNPDPSEWPKVKMAMAGIIIIGIGVLVGTGYYIGRG